MTPGARLTIYGALLRESESLLRRKIGSDTVSRLWRLWRAAEELRGVPMSHPTLNYCELTEAMFMT